MRELPFDLRFDVGAASVHLVHGSPRKVNEYLFEDKPARLYERLALAEDAGVMAFGHTHKP
jgi:predicted phosphodiesterase